mmetsp:Transcript_43077/g.111616  ORF Transcript_43077/g.111616 Transcript_43077/m.111616 type:complete len:81 (-) Transcript_43077:1511-1753(-)
MPLHIEHALYIYVEKARDKKDMQKNEKKKKKWKPKESAQINTIIRKREKKRREDHLHTCIFRCVYYMYNQSVSTSANCEG